MRYALINNNKVEAQPKQQGLCPHCSEPVIAKCGSQKVWHWAHRSKANCDSWWETETEWHRAWKNNFPVGWQEISLIDEKTGEKHIADVRTAHNLVIEFQHSRIDPKERVLREKFYKNMLWVVDGTRLKKIILVFVKERKVLYKNNKVISLLIFQTKFFRKVGSIVLCLSFLIFVDLLYPKKIRNKI